MSQTQITFLSDKQLKNLTLKKAKADGITLKALFTMAMKAYLQGDLKVSLISNQVDPIFQDKDITKKSNELGKLLKNIKL